MKADPNHEGLIAEVRAVVEKALKAVKDVKEDEWKKIFLFSFAISFSTYKDRSTDAGYLEELARLIREGGRHGQREGMQAIHAILGTVPDSILGSFYNEIKKIADLLPELSAGRGHPLRVQIENLKINYEAENLEKKGFSPLICDLLSLLSTDLDGDEDEINIAAMEFEILHEKSTYDPQLRRLKEEFPELYALHSVFFNEALRTKDPERMMYQRGKKVHKHNRATGFFDDHPEDAPPQPIRRAEPKIGRNDPCPCGSGKKYKKCCGA
jgi:hypothetical protein